MQSNATSYRYGTTLRGLLRDHAYNFDVADYMVKAHDISSVAHLIQPDPALNRMLAHARVPVWVGCCRRRCAKHYKMYVCINALKESRY
jgi:hypothetical protein